MTQHSHLSFERTIRSGTDGRTRVTYWDYIIDDTPLRELLKVGDMISPLGWLRPAPAERFRQILLMRQPSDLRLGRVPIFVCPECADYACGTVTASVTKSRDHVIWDSFAYENSCSEEIYPIQKHHPCKLVFLRREYWSTISSLPLSALASPAPKHPPASVMQPRIILASTSGSGI